MVNLEWVWPATATEAALFMVQKGWSAVPEPELVQTGLASSTHNVVVEACAVVWDSKYPPSGTADSKPNLLRLRI